MTDRTQLRGQKLLDAIEACIRQLASERERYVYNASEVARLVGCSRPTLNAKTDFIDKVLTKIGAEKRLRSEHPLLEQFRGRIEDLESENKSLIKELEALRKHHAEIYSTLLNNSLDVSILIKPFVEDESIKRGKCILCNQKVLADHSFLSRSRVIQLNDHRHEDD